MPTIKAFIRIIAFFLWCLLIVPLQLIVKLCTKGDGIYVIPRLWHKGVCVIFGITVETRGTAHTKGPVLFVSNHISYLDIPAIGSLLIASFVAKKEVAQWPVFGFLSKLQNTAFISRSRHEAGNEKNNLELMLDSGKSLILFPEGTSSNGKEVLPFKSSLFSLAMNYEDKDKLTIQPMTLALQSIGKQKNFQEEDRDLYAWYGEMTLPPHLWSFAKANGVKIIITFHEPQNTAMFSDRKTLAKQCQTLVAEPLEQQNTLEKIEKTAA